MKSKPQKHKTRRAGISNERQGQAEERLIKNDCVVPPALRPEAASKFVLGVDDKGREDVLGYMAGQAPDETVKHLEKIKSEKVLGARYDVWDVVTDKGRWWVMSNLMNLYSQELFPSLDFTLSFHIGLMERLIAKDSRDSRQSNRDIFASAWRKWEQAAEAADQADEPEEYQAVAMRCREALLSFVKEAASPELVPTGKTAPKFGDFQAWSELLIEQWAPGLSAKDLRSYLKTDARAVWQLVNWLTHSTHASHYEAGIAVAATEGVLGSLLTAFARHTKGLPRRCPTCGSYKISSHYLKEEDAYQPYCPACGWEGELMRSSS